jgi:KipI family sensor histidine kinase inhibitor
VTTARAVRFLGDAAFHVEAASMEEAHGLALAVRRQGWSGVEEVVVGHRAVTVVVDPNRAQLGELAHAAATLAPSGPGELSARTIEIPVVFDGPDLEEVASSSGTTSSGVSAAIVTAELVVAMVGFVPGFAYLEGLPGPLAAVPRRASPRPRVEAGAVAIGGGYAGVYPLATPGGWQVVGHTEMRLFDGDTPPFAVLRPADRVRFREVERSHAAGGPARPTARPPLVARPTRRGGGRVPSVRVLQPGMCTTIQDAGRIGAAELGVPRAGVADSLSARLANRGVGNLEVAALLEMTLTGAVLQFESARYVALVGDAGIAIDGRPMARGAVHPVAAGQIVEVGPIGPGPRAFLAVGGGIENPPLLGSRSSDLLCGIGPGPLVAGDELALGEPGRARGRFECPQRCTTLRVLPGPDGRTRDGFATGSYVVGPRSDRTGVRLEPDRPLRPVEAVDGSVAMVTGAVQLPPDGQPIILGVDHATLGGYPVVAVVISADLPRLGQLLPGDTVHLEPVDAAQAARLHRDGEASLERRLRDWYPTQAG